MLRKLLFLGATVWLGKKGYDALMAAQTDGIAPSSAGGNGSSSRASGADHGLAPLNPVFDTEAAGRLHDAKLQSAEVHDPA